MICACVWKGTREGMLFDGLAIGDRCSLKHTYNLLYPRSKCCQISALYTDAQHVDASSYYKHIQWTKTHAIKMHFTRCFRTLFSEIGIFFHQLLQKNWSNSTRPNLSKFNLQQQMLFIIISILTVTLLYALLIFIVLIYLVVNATLPVIGFKFYSSYHFFYLFLAV